MWKLRFLLFCLFLGCFSLAYSKINEDSLLRILPTKHDTSKAKIYYALIRALAQKPDDSTKVDLYYQKAKVLAEQNKMINFLIDLHAQYGQRFRFVGQYEKALQLYDLSKKLAIESNNARGLAKYNLNAGTTLFYMGDFKKAISYFISAEKIFSQLKDTTQMANCLNNIAEGFLILKEYNRALEYHRKTLHLQTLRGDTYRMQISNYNIGNLYIHTQEYDSSKHYTERAYELAKIVKDSEGAALCLLNLGMIELHFKNYPEAKKYLEKALLISESVKTNDHSAAICFNLANLYHSQNNFNLAIEYGKKGLKYAEEFRIASVIKDGTNMLSESYAKVSDFKNAYWMLKRSRDVGDSLLNKENMSVMKELQAKFDSDKKENEIKLLNNENKLKQTTIEKEKTFRNSLYGIIGLGIVLLFVLVYAFNNKRKSNLKLQSLYSEIREQNKAIVQKNEEINLQKTIVEEKNQEILDSIHYAQKIQQAILPSLDEFQSLLPNSFVFFKPKDIVSGDFYWISKRDQFVFFTAADCTGHGVPGGFMSMLGVSLLNEIINQKLMYQPAIILDELREGVINALKQTGASGENKDGMDIGLCRLNLQNGELVFAGANNAMYLVREGAIAEYKPDKMPVGIYAGDSKPFSQKILQLQSGDQLYLLTDGFADQFGGPKGKKFKYRQLEDLLLRAANQNSNSQLKMLDSSFHDWKQEYMQMDDVLVIGFQWT